MKRNILTIIILAATLVNVTLSAVCVFVIVPAYKKTDKLMSKVTMMLELELNGEIMKEGVDPEKVPAKDKFTYTLEDGEMNVKLSNDPGETKSRFIQVEVGIILNKTADDYKAISDLIAENDVLIKDMVQDIISGYTASTVDPEKHNIKKALIERLQKEFDSQCIIDVAFPKYLLP